MMDELRELYQEIILDHGKRPRNHRDLPDHNRHAHGDNPMCGDKIDVFLKVGDDDRIEDVTFLGRGCAISQASASLMTEILKGKTVEDARRLFEAFHDMCTHDEPGPPADVDAEAMDRLMVLAGVKQFPMRVKCATLAWHTMTAAMKGEKRASTEWAWGGAE